MFLYAKSNEKRQSQIKSNIFILSLAKTENP